MQKDASRNTMSAGQRQICLFNRDESGDHSAASAMDRGGVGQQYCLDDRGSTLVQTRNIHKQNTVHGSS
jgi:ethanolamine utilization protein EutA (predicted chaperonin)